MKIQHIKVSQMNSPKSGYPVANQFEIQTKDGVYFQSYRTIIAFRANDGAITLDENYWDYSRTTGKYRNEFLGENTAETRKKIKSGEYKLADLN
jgi:hypothetical protein